MMLDTRDSYCRSPLAPALKISENKDLEVLGELIAEARVMSAKDLEHFIKEASDQALSEAATIAVCVIIPVQAVPKPAFDFLAKVIANYGFRQSPTFPPKWKLAVAMRFARASILASQTDIVIKDDFFTHLYAADRGLFQIPYLYFAAHIGRPVDLTPQLTHHLRRDTMSLYYSGVNKLLLHRYEAADVDLLHAWTLSRGAKDLRSSIVRELSLAAFLSNKSRYVFESRLPGKYRPKSGPENKIWALEGDDPVPSIRGFFQKFQTEIRDERARRILIDLQASASQIKFTQLAHLLGVPESSPILLKYPKSDVVKFGETPLGDKLQEELDKIAALSAHIH
jgi:hypothetical protein